MKKIILPIFTLTLLFSCKENSTEKPILENETKVKVAEKNTKKEKIDTLSFSDYQIKFVNTKEKAKIDFNSNSDAKMYKTSISEEYKRKDVDFASYYITVTWGCGGGCENGVLIDVRDGKVYDFPESEGNYNDTRKNSNLFIRGFVGHFPGWAENMNASLNYYKWNENTKKFETLKSNIEFFDKKFEY